MPIKKPMRTNIAKKRPVLRALGRSSSGSLLETIEMKMMLSMPSTISKKQSVSNASHVSALRNNSIRQVSGFGLCEPKLHFGSVIKNHISEQSLTSSSFLGTPSPQREQLVDEAVINK